jgi:hypothetical protein
MFRKAFSSTIFRNSANGILSPPKKKGQTQKQLGCLVAGYHANFESKLLFLLSSYMLFARMLSLFMVVVDQRFIKFSELTTKQCSAADVHLPCINVYCFPKNFTFFNEKNCL